MINLNETISRIKSVGPSNVRVVPMQGENMMTGLYQIEICESNIWNAILTGLQRSTAEDMVRQATNRVICG